MSFYFFKNFKSFFTVIILQLSQFFPLFPPLPSHPSPHSHSQFPNCCPCVVIHQHYIKFLKEYQVSAYFGSTYTKIGTIQRRSAWPLHNDDMQICEVFHIFPSRGTYLGCRFDPRSKCV